MTTTPSREAGPRPDAVSEAVAALTMVARRTRVIGAGTPEEHTEPADFAEVACHIITTVAANVGGVEALLAGRPGSWEADYVRQIVHSTAGENLDDLLRDYRTEPVRISVDVDRVFDDFGLDGLYEEAMEELGEREEVADTALLDANTTEEEQVRLDAIAESIGSWESWSRTEEATARANELMRESRTIVEGIAQRATEAGDPLAAALSNAIRARLAVDALHDQDQTAYREAYIAAVRQSLSGRGITVDVEAVPQSEMASSDGASEADPFTEALSAHAYATAPLPMTGAAPDWTDGTPADALRRAGLTYTARAQQVADHVPGSPR